MVESGASEIDPNVILMRVGSVERGAATSSNSNILTSVEDGERFLISFVHKNFTDKSEVNRFKLLTSDTFDKVVQKFQATLESKISEFEERIKTTFGTYTAKDNLLDDRYF